MVLAEAFVLFALQVGALASTVPVYSRSTEGLLRVPVSKRVKLDKLKHIPTRDAARAQALKNRPFAQFSANAGQAVGVEVANLVVTYIAAIAVGAAQTVFDVIVDTGSSNTWVGANGTATFAASSTTVNTGNAAGVTYGSGSFTGTQVLDLVQFGGPLVIANQSISVASTQVGFDGLDGIVGIGPVALTQGTVNNTATVPTVTDNLFTQGVIPQRVVSVSFAPTNLTFDVNGELVFGGVDTTKFTGALTTVPVTKVSPSNLFFGVDLGISFNGRTLLANASGIVDTGTTLLLLATNAFNSYARTTGGTIDRNVGLLRLTAAQFRALPSLVFTIGGKTFTLTPDGQRLPAKLNTAFGGVANAVYLMVGDLGNPSGEGFDFVFGQQALERFYTVFDSSGFVSFATTNTTNAVLNN